MCPLRPLLTSTISRKKNYSLDSFITWFVCKSCSNLTLVLYSCASIFWHLEEKLISRQSHLAEAFLCICPNLNSLKKKKFKINRWKYTLFTNLTNRLSSTEDSTEKEVSPKVTQEQGRDHTGVGPQCLWFLNINMSLRWSRMEYLEGFTLEASSLLWLQCSQLLKVSIDPLLMWQRAWPGLPGARRYLFAHADLHNRVAYERLLQVVVLLLFKPFDVSPGTFHKVPAIK